MQSNMDYTFAEVLTREELINILIERQLNLPNMREMSHCDLMRIYRNFALPLARREDHRTARNRLAFNDKDKRINKAVVNTDNGGVCSMDIDECVNMQVGNKIHSTNSNLLMERPMNCEKRSRDYKHLNPLTDEYLSTATKRIKISWS
ncbi:uncharacterized protein [Eurosta solidaginis]|uniref:uncharacterized protein n=1 Tax=Eurosta solidaginis TaxID=178769 RepID=UPI0035316F60